MNASDKAAQLRAEAEALESLADLEEQAAAAKSAYRDDPSEENRAAHREASAALNSARADIRGEAPAVGGDASVSTDEEV